MTNITIKIDGATAHKLGQQGALTTGMVGATVAFEFSPEWEGLIKTAVFRGGGVTRDLVGIGDTVPIPPEVLQAEGYLAVGVEGYDAEHTLVIPTTWENAAAYIHAGANASGDPAADPTLPIWAQLQAMIGDLSALDTNTKNNLVAAINELAAKSGGTVDDEAVAKLVERYLADNPITAESIGAISAPPTAQVGQTIRVKSVDEDGKPVEWECVDLPTGGSEEKWELLFDTTLEEEVKSIEAKFLDNPQKKIYAVLDTLAADADTNYMPTNIWTGTTDWRQYIKFYPKAMPMKTPRRSVIEAEVFDDLTAIVKASYGTVNDNDGTSKVRMDAVKYSEMFLVPVDPYGNPINPRITAITTNTYGTFVAGTRLRVWGVAK